jgi:hypothetical protein
MRTFNFQIRRIHMNTVSEQLPQFNIVAHGIVDAGFKAKKILGVDSSSYTFKGEVTDGDNVWDFNTGEKL